MRCKLSFAATVSVLVAVPFAPWRRSDARWGRVTCKGGYTVEQLEVSRRTLLKGGGAAAAGLTAVRVAGPAHAFPGEPDEEVVPWLDQPAPNPVPNVIVRQLDWEALDSRLTPPGQFFVINHYGQPALNAQDWRLGSVGWWLTRNR